MLNNINTIKKERGFTIVELLIVIVVIAILAAITIVAYNGIQNRARTSSGQSLANTIVKKIEALNSIKGTYFAGTAAGKAASDINTLATTAPTAPEAKIDDTSSVIAASSTSASGLTASTADNGQVVSVWGCPEGADIWYWDYTTGAAVSTTAGEGCA